MSSNSSLVKMCGSALLSVCAGFAGVIIPPGAMDTGLYLLDWISEENDNAKNRVETKLVILERKLYSEFSQKENWEEYQACIDALANGLSKCPPEVSAVRAAYSKLQQYIAPDKVYRELSNIILAKIIEAEHLDETTLDKKISLEILDSVFKEILFDDELLATFREGMLEDLHARILALKESPFQSIHEKFPTEQDFYNTQLLQAKYRIVPFLDLSRQLKDLLDWARDEQERLKVRVYAGSGGVGKTRLSIEAHISLSDEKWTGGFLGQKLYSNYHPADRRAVFHSKSKVFLVIDYAENRVAEIDAILADAIQKVGENPGLLVRVILLARTKEDWLDEIGTYQPNPVADFISHKGIEIKKSTRELALSGKQMDLREKIYRSAHENFSKFVNTDSVDLLLPDLSNSDYGRVLNILIKALLDSLPRELLADGQIADTIQDNLLDVLIKYEYKSWRRAFGEDFERLSKLFQDAIICLTLAGGVPRKDLEDFLSFIPSFSEVNRGDIDKIISKLEMYHSVHENKVYGLVPDIIGENFVSRNASVDNFTPIIKSQKEEYYKNAILIITRTISIGTRHGEQIQQLTGQIISELLKLESFSRNYFSAFLCFQVTRQVVFSKKRLIALLIEKDLLTLDEALAFVLRVGNLSDLFYFFSSLENVQIKVLKKSLTKEKVHPLIKKSFDQLIVKSPFGRSKQKRKETYKLLQPYIDIGELVHHLSLNSTYNDLLNLVYLWPDNFSKLIFKNLTREHKKNIHINSRMTKDRSVGFMFRVKNPHARDIINELGMEQVCRTAVTILNLQQFSDFWRKSSDKMHEMTFEVLKSLDIQQWKKWVVSSGFYGTTRFFSEVSHDLPEKTGSEFYAAVNESLEELANRNYPWGQINGSLGILGRLEENNNLINKDLLLKFRGNLENWLNKNLPKDQLNIQKLKEQNSSFEDTIAFVELVWKYRPKLRAILLEHFFDILPKVSTWSQERFHKLNNWMMLIRSETNDRDLLAQHVEKLFSIGLTPIKDENSGSNIFHSALYFWNLMALQKVFEDKISSIKNVPEQKIIDEFIENRIISKKKHIISEKQLFFVAGILQAFSNRYLDELSAYLVEFCKDMKKSKESVINSDSTGVIYFFSLIGLQLLDGKGDLHKGGPLVMNKDKVIEKINEYKAIDSSLEWLVDYLNAPTLQHSDASILNLHPLLY